MHIWLNGAAERLAEVVGDEVAEYELDSEVAERLLDLARIVAHDSGERTNAPLAAYLVGLAAGKHPEWIVSDLIDSAIGALEA
jgi:hypothetical protein